MQANEPSRARSGGCDGFEAQLPLIDDVTAYVCSRQYLRHEEAEDFASSVRVHLLEDDCAVLNRFSGRSALSTYLTSVILNLARDDRMRRWGRWRSSAAAQRLGTVAVQLEILTLRDGRSFRDAVEILRRHHEVELTVGELADLAGQLPPRTRRRFEGEESLAKLTTSESESPEARVRDAERAETLVATQRALAEALESLSAEDRLILKLRFQDGLKISAIARALGRRAKPLYASLQRLLGRVRNELERRGLSAGAVLGSLGWSGAEIKIDCALAEDAEPWNRPSNLAEEE